MPASNGFPVTIEHKYGNTTIGAKPERVVSVGFGEHDGLLAIGVEPVAVRDWYGDMPYATWPWAQDELGDLTPDVIPSTELNFEQIAALQPDLIVGIASGMTDTDYATLSQIAPTIAQPGDYVDYGTPWDVALAIAGRATGHSAEATQAIADAKAKFAAVRDAHPEWEGQNAGVTYIYENLPGGYSSEDVRPRFLAELGLGTPAAYDELAGDQFWFTVSAEQLPELDADVIIWLVDGEAGQQAVRDLPLRPTLSAFQEGREILADPLLGGAFSHFSPLSFDYVIEHLVPELELALDGDPGTAVPSAASLNPR
ncbi:MAG TPA: iron-siderophore ABC transporter substrate-binding protein [Ilumatobacter sp.]|nr:iron-siderophore ABC transporter substrate-binding protein [Ilumatobacter sp.]